MKNFKKIWEIQHNWQLLFPFFGILILGYSAFKIANALTKTYSLILTIAAAALIFFLILTTVLQKVFAGTLVLSDQSLLLTLLCFQQIEHLYSSFAFLQNSYP